MYVYDVRPSLFFLQYARRVGVFSYFYFAEAVQILGYFAAGLEYWDTVKDFPVRYGAVIILQYSELVPRILRYS